MDAEQNEGRTGRNETRSKEKANTKGKQMKTTQNEGRTQRGENGTKSGKNKGRTKRRSNRMQVEPKEGGT